MEANPTKFQGSLFSHGRIVPPEKIDILDISIPFSPAVQILGIHIDSNLQFEKHISMLCKKNLPDICMQYQEYLSTSILIAVNYCIMLS